MEFARLPTPKQFQLALSEFLTGGTGERFWSEYRRLYDVATVFRHEDDEIRDLKREVEELRLALQDANMDLAEARAAAAEAKEKKTRKG